VAAKAAAARSGAKAAGEKAVARTVAAKAVRREGAKRRSGTVMVRCQLPPQVPIQWRLLGAGAVGVRDE